jgi:multidrug efflux pump subunit AcrB
MIDRSRAIELGLNATTVANNINISLSSSEQVAPNFWTDPKTGIPYYLAVQTPEPRESSLSQLGNTPVSGALSPAGIPVPGMLSNVATFRRDSLPTNANQSNIQPVYEVYASVQGRDLGSVAGEIDKVVSDLQKQLVPGNSIQIVGQIQSMNDSFRNLGIGLLFAAVFVYLLMVVNNQNFGDPFVVILAFARRQMSSSIAVLSTSPAATFGRAGRRALVGVAAVMRRSCRNLWLKISWPYITLDFRIALRNRFPPRT